MARGDELKGEQEFQSDLTRGQILYSDILKLNDKEEELRAKKQFEGTKKINLINKRLKKALELRELAKNLKKQYSKGDVGKKVGGWSKEARRVVKNDKEKLSRMEKASQKALEDATKEVDKLVDKKRAEEETKLAKAEAIGKRVEDMKEKEQAELDALEQEVLGKVDVSSSEFINESDEVSADFSPEAQAQIEDLNKQVEEAADQAEEQISQITGKKAKRLKRKRITKKRVGRKKKEVKGKYDDQLKAREKLIKKREKELGEAYKRIEQAKKGGQSTTVDEGIAKSLKKNLDLLKSLEKIPVESEGKKVSKESGLAVADSETPASPPDEPPAASEPADAPPPPDTPPVPPPVPSAGGEGPRRPERGPQQPLSKRRVYATLGAKLVGNLGLALSGTKFFVDGAKYLYERGDIGKQQQEVQDAIEGMIAELEQRRGEGEKGEKGALVRRFAEMKTKIRERQDLTPAQKKEMLKNLAGILRSHKEKSDQAREESMEVSSTVIEQYIKTKVSKIQLLKEGFNTATIGAAITAGLPSGGAGVSLTMPFLMKMRAVGYIGIDAADRWLQEKDNKTVEDFIAEGKKKKAERLEEPAAEGEEEAETEEKGWWSKTKEAVTGVGAGLKKGAEESVTWRALSGSATETFNALRLQQGETKMEKRVEFAKAAFKLLRYAGITKQAIQSEQIYASYENFHKGINSALDNTDKISLENGYGAVEAYLEVVSMGMYKADRGEIQSGSAEGFIKIEDENVSTTKSADVRGVLDIKEDQGVGLTKAKGGILFKHSEFETAYGNNGSVDIFMTEKAQADLDRLGVRIEDGKIYLGDKAMNDITFGGDDNGDALVDVKKLIIDKTGDGKIKFLFIEDDRETESILFDPTNGRVAGIHGEIGTSQAHEATLEQVNQRFDSLMTLNGQEAEVTEFHMTADGREIPDSFMMGGQEYDVIAQTEVAPGVFEYNLAGTDETMLDGYLNLNESSTFSYDQIWSKEELLPLEMGKNLSSYEQMIDAKGWLATHPAMKIDATNHEVSMLHHGKYKQVNVDIPGMDIQASGETEIMIKGYGWEREIPMEVNDQGEVVVNGMSPDKFIETTKLFIIKETGINNPELVLAGMGEFNEENIAFLTKNHDGFNILLQNEALKGIAFSEQVKTLATRTDNGDLFKSLIGQVEAAHQSGVNAAETISYINGHQMATNEVPGFLLAARTLEKTFGGGEQMLAKADQFSSAGFDLIRYREDQVAFLAPDKSFVTVNPQGELSFYDSQGEQLMDRLDNQPVGQQINLDRVVPEMIPQWHQAAENKALASALLLEKLKGVNLDTPIGELKDLAKSNPEAFETLKNLIGKNSGYISGDGMPQRYLYDSMQGAEFSTARGETKLREVIDFMTENKSYARDTALELQSEQLLNKFRDSTRGFAGVGEVSRSEFANLPSSSIANKNTLHGAVKGLFRNTDELHKAIKGQPDLWAAVTKAENADRPFIEVYQEVIIDRVGDYPQEIVRTTEGLEGTLTFQTDATGHIVEIRSRGAFQSASSEQVSAYLSKDKWSKLSDKMDGLSAEVKDSINAEVKNILYLDKLAEKNVDNFTAEELAFIDEKRNEIERNIDELNQQLGEQEAASAQAIADEKARAAAEAAREDDLARTIAEDKIESWRSHMKEQLGLENVSEKYANKADYDKLVDVTTHYEEEIRDANELVEESKEHFEDAQLLAVSADAPPTQKALAEKIAPQLEQTFNERATQRDVLVQEFEAIKTKVAEGDLESVTFKEDGKDVTIEFKK